MMQTAETWSNDQKSQAQRAKSAKPTQH